MPTSDTDELRLAIRKNRFWRRGERSSGLLVFTHGFRSRPADYEDLLVRLLTDPAGCLTGCDLLPFRYRAGAGSNVAFGGPAPRGSWRWRRYTSVELDREIRRLVAEHQYQDVFLLGHSVGGILLRTTIVEGGEDLQAKREEERWVHRIRRVVLLAAPNRGIVIEGFVRRLLYTLFRCFGRARLLKNAIRESEFMNDLRLGWIVKFRRRDRPPPEIFQILGDRDATVSKYDSTDVVRFQTTRQVLLPGVRHRDFKIAPDTWRTRLDRAVLWLFGQPASKPRLPDGAYETIRGAFETDLTPSAPRTAPTSARTRRLVFLIHGIRDFGEWQSTLARAIRALDPAAEVVAVRYGYFNIFQFLLGFQRFRAVRSFTDRYIENLAELEAPLDEVEIAVGAHSNGTYVLANALSKYSYMRVDRIYLAGSVLPAGFPWHRLGAADPGRKRAEVRNDCADLDWPVGILCSALRWAFLWKAIGVAGYRGFRAARGQRAGSGPRVFNNRYLHGHHGVAFEPCRHESVARYLLTGKPRLPAELEAGQAEPGRENWLMWALYRCAPALLAAVGFALYKLYARFIPWAAEALAGLPERAAALPEAARMAIELAGSIPPGPFQIAASAVVTLALVVVLVRI